MRIQSATVQLAAATSTRVSATVSDGLETWGGTEATPDDPPATTHHATPPPTGAPEAPSAKSLRQLLVERLLAHRLIATAQAPSQVPSAGQSEATSTPTAVPSGPGVEITHTETLTIEQAYAFAAVAEVQTTDGRAMHIELAVDAAHQETSTSSLTLQAGAPKAKDPLVLSSTGVTLDAAHPVSFDLDGDGTTESMASLGPGAAFLAIDRDGDGQIRDGRELFGPTTGDGFTELQALDGDQNGWIDEADAAWGSLRVFRPGEPPQALLAADVGAIAVQRVDTPFELTGGALRSTSLYLKEQGGAGVVQHLDLSV